MINPEETSESSRGGYELWMRYESWGKDGEMAEVHNKGTPRGVARGVKEC